MLRVVRCVGLVVAAVVSCLVVTPGVVAVATSGEQIVAIDPGPGSAIAAGESHSCAVSGNGEVACWGSNGSGELGTGDTIDRLTPTLVGLPGGATATAITAGGITAGGSHSCAVLNTGAVACWGDNGFGQLGTGDTTNRSAPTLVGLPGGATAIAIAAGGFHSCAVLNTGAVACWGSNGLGQLGTGDTTDRLAPTLVGLPGGATATAIAAGRAHSCAVLNTGGVACWGDNFFGQLGTGDTTDRSAPTLVGLPAGATATAIAAGSAHSCAVLNTGAVACWGSNGGGRLGTGDTTDRSAPTLVGLPGGATATAIAAASFHSCAVLNTGEVVCWGSNVFGELGTGDTTNRLAPTLLASLPGGATATAITAGGSHSCAVLNTGEVACWGYNFFGQLGTGDTTNTSTPTLVGLPGGATATAIAAGFAHSCAVLNTGEVACWGSNGSGRLGTGDTTDRSAPTLVGLPGGATATAIAAGFFHSCAVLNTGEVACWGDNGFGQLGTGDTTNRSAPTLVGLPGGATAIAITAGAFHSCAVLNTGAVACWGDNGSGQLGTGDTTNTSTPTLVASLPDGATATAITAGGSHSCAVLNTGAVACWGSNGNGRLGTGDTTNRSAPTLVGLPGGATATAITAGSFHSCAVLNTGEVACWGNNGNGQLGTGDTNDRLTPTLVGLPGGATATAITAGSFHSCAVLNTGAVACWGYNFFGQLGTGDTTNTSTPTLVASLPGGATATAMSAGGSHSCAVTSGGGVACWGSNATGQLGRGITTETPSPSPDSALLPPVPARPESVTATAGDSVAMVSWTPGSDQGSPITGYEAISIPGGETCTTTGATSCTVSRLTNNTTYTFSVSATNKFGDSALSLESAAVTPTARPSVTVTPASGQSGSTSTNPVRFTVSFDQAVNGFNAADVSIGGTATTSSPQVSGSGPYTVSVTASSSGTVTARVKADAITNANGQTNPASNTVTVTYNTPTPDPDPNPDPDPDPDPAPALSDPRPPEYLAPSGASDQPGPGGVLAAGGVLKIRVPESAGGKTVFGNLASARAAGPGFATAYPCLDGPPVDGDGNYTKSDLNFNGSVLPAMSNRLITTADTNGDICVYTSTATALIVDINATADEAITPIDNQRTDTRQGDGILPAGDVLKIRIPNAAGKTVFGNLASARAAGPGFATAYPCLDGPPVDGDGNYTKSDLNFNGSVLPAMSNRLITTADTNGDICVYTSTATALIVDINATADEAITPIDNQRTDTRQGDGILPAGDVLKIRIPNAAGKTVFGNLASARAAGPGFATAYPCLDGPPVDGDGNYTKSDLNFNGSVLPAMSNRLITTADTNGDICVYTSTATALIVDINATADEAITPIDNQRTDTRIIDFT